MDVKVKQGGDGLEGWVSHVTESNTRFTIISLERGRRG